jgi:hypothetical protein
VLQNVLLLQSRRKIVGLILLVMLAMIHIRVPPGWAADKGWVTLLFYDRDGLPLSPDQVRRLSNNGSADRNNDFLVDPLTLRVVAAKALRVRGSNFTFDVAGVPVALAFNWPTEPQGYSLILLDNGGSGYSFPAVVNFTYQAARDVKLRLDAALAARPDYQPSREMRTAYDEAAGHMAAADASTEQSLKGKEGQLALDRLAAAYNALLFEHGPACARATCAQVPPWLGLTIDRTTDYRKTLDLAASLTQPYGWIRIVFDAGKRPSDYAEFIRYAKDKGLKVMGEPVDSFYDKRYTRARYRQRFVDFITAFPEVDAWEVGNEVNGGWLSREIPGKIADAVREVRERAPGKLTVLTLFWQLNTETAKTSMFTWIDANLPASVRKDIDVVFVSLYQEQAPMGVFFDRMMLALRREFPAQKIGLGELGYWIPGQQFWWAHSKDDPNGAGKRGTASQYYHAALDYAGSVGGGFWWTYVQDFPADPAMQSILRNLRDTLQDPGSGP